MFTDHEKMVMSLQKRSNRLCKLGFSDLTLIVGCSIKFIDSDITLRNILLCCQDFNAILCDDVYKQSLTRTDQHRVDRKRKTLWCKILKIDPSFVQSEFQAYQRQAETELPLKIRNEIDQDIQRSFRFTDGIDDVNLRKILYTYAVVNPELDYCQGMNFIAGFLYLFLGDEALAFNIMRHIIDIFELSTLFNTELKILKLNFYRLDRLISMLLPDLHSHLKEESVNSSYFSSSYFITLFTQVMQHQPSKENMWKLLRIWDYFIIVSIIRKLSKLNYFLFLQDGWKAIFKASIMILRDHEEELLDMPFEILLSQMPNIQ